MQRDRVPQANGVPHANDNAGTAADRDPRVTREPSGLDPLSGASLDEREASAVAALQADARTLERDDSADTLAATRGGRESLLDAGETPLQRNDSTGALDGSAQKLELLEEVPDVRVRRVPAGAAVLRKEVETRTETVELELRTETLVVRRLEATGDGTEPAPVEVDGRLLEPGEEARLVLFREEADVRKLPVVYERVSIERRDVAERESRPLELGRERLNVDVQGEAIVRDPGSTIDGRSSTTGRG